MKVMLVISYDGSKFFGFQRQNTLRNVQGELEHALTVVLGENIVVKGAGRTDRGVHAYGQVVHFETTKNITNLKRKLNNFLEDIRIKKIKIVSDDFHARHSAIKKTYIYKVDLSKKRNNKYYLSINYPVDIKKMKKTAKLLEGTHDFRNFVSGERLDYVTHIESIKIIKFNQIIYFIFKGAGFYRYMIRNLVGALLEVGHGKVTHDLVKMMLNLENCEKRLPTSSPNGLYLYKIKYERKMFK